MQTVTIEQIKREMVGQVIPRIEAKVLKVYDRKTGVGQYGEWSLQNAEIQDSTGKMKVVFSQVGSQSSLEGRTVVFKSMASKHVLKGVQAQENDYKGNVTVELKVTNAALIVGSDEEQNVSQVESSTRPPMDSRITPLIDEKPSHEALKQGVALVRNRMTQIAGLYSLSYKTALIVKQANMAIKDEEVKDIATTLFIQASREGLADKMPVRTVETFYNEEAVDQGQEPDESEPF